MRGYIDFLSLNDMEQFGVVGRHEGILPCAHKVEGHATSPEIVGSPVEFLALTSLWGVELGAACILGGQVCTVLGQHL